MVTAIVNNSLGNSLLPYRTELLHETMLARFCGAGSHLKTIYKEYASYCSVYWVLQLYCWIYFPISQGPKCQKEQLQWSFYRKAIWAIVDEINMAKHHVIKPAIAADTNGRIMNGENLSLICLLRTQSWSLKARYQTHWSIKRSYPMCIIKRESWFTNESSITILAVQYTKKRQCNLSKTFRIWVKGHRHGHSMKTTQRATVLPFNGSHDMSGEPIVPMQQQHPWGEILLAWECVSSDSSAFTSQRTSKAYIWWRFLCCYPEYAGELTFRYLFIRYSCHFVNSLHGYWHTHRLPLAGAEQQVTDSNRCHWLRYISLTA